MVRTHLLKPKTKLTKNNIPKKKFGKLDEISILALIDSLKYTCIVEIDSDNKKAALFIINGKLKDVRIGKIKNVKYINKITKWKKGNFSKAEYTEDILYMASLLKSNYKLSYNNNNNVKAEIHIEKGIVKKAVYNEEVGVSAFKKFLFFINTGTVKMEQNKQETGQLNLSYLHIEKIIYSVNYKKVHSINVKKLNTAIDELKQDLGDALIAANIYHKDSAQYICEFNSQSRSIPFFNQLTKDINITLNNSKLYFLSNYYMLDLKEDLMMIVLLLEDYRCEMILNSNKINLGLLHSIAIPKVKEAFTDALK